MECYGTMLLSLEWQLLSKWQYPQQLKLSDDFYLEILEWNTSQAMATRRNAKLKLTSMPRMANSSFLSFLQMVDDGRRMDDS